MFSAPKQKSSQLLAHCKAAPARLRVLKDAIAKERVVQAQMSRIVADLERESAVLAETTRHDRQLIIQLEVWNALQHLLVTEPVPCLLIMPRDSLKQSSFGIYSAVRQICERLRQNSEARASMSMAFNAPRSAAAILLHRRASAAEAAAASRNSICCCMNGSITPIQAQQQTTTHSSPVLLKRFLKSYCPTGNILASKKPTLSLNFWNIF